MVWHVGVRGVPEPSVAHHNIHFGTEWASAFDALLKPGRADARPVPAGHGRPRWTTPSLAPEGCSTLYVLEPVPNLNGAVDWRAPRRRTDARSAARASSARTGTRTEILTEELVTPLDWQAQGMAAGTPFALAHTFAQTGPFRPPNVEKQLPGLFFAGSGTVPGVGVPMVLVSGKLVAERIGALPAGADPVSRTPRPGRRGRAALLRPATASAPG